MKVLSTLVLAVLAVVAQSSYAAESAIPVVSAESILRSMAAVRPANLINWKVGDKADYDVSIGSFGKLGTMTKEVIKEEGNAIWVRQNADLMIQKDNSEMLIDRADGSIKKYIHNGKEEAIPNDQPEIISQDSTDVTVPAGTFQCIHVVIKTKQIEKAEIWVNPRDTVMEGMLKMAMEQQGMPISIELTSFKRMP